MAAVPESGALDVLVPSAAAGDKRALQQVINIIYPEMVVYCRARVPNDTYPGPEDIAQEICLAVASSISKYVEGEVPFRAFVYGIARHKIADGFRARKREQFSYPTDEVPEVPHEGEGPESVAVTADVSNKVGELLDVLNERAREIVILRVFEGYSAEQTAEIIGSTPGAVRVAQHRASSKLKKALESSSEYAELGAIQGKLADE